MKKTIGIIGEYNPEFPPHTATNEAIQHAAKKLDLVVDFEWVSTESILSDFGSLVTKYNGFWIAPGSPYKNMGATLELIQYARLHNIPTLGTCGGFQHMVIEFARNVLGITDAEHAEYDPYASRLVVNHLTCSLAGQTLKISLKTEVLPQHKSLVYQLYNETEAIEKYYCNFGLNPAYQAQLHQAGFKVVGTDETDEARIMELPAHRFYIATLFVPQNSSTFEKPHPLVSGFLSKL
ncbi:CTP synthase C-terminal region-related (seleno)protein [Chondrinema litorale]|uniref:CTP synthase C-terminal region-related (seleno)protein n=1 Tax=Chondrinema litorale TaxID=2994555 RepID=UPI002543B3D2|nr:hypothetical protein [Chondrinema litorale]UZR95227.1 hypothetical protein OQ292_05265 [Chondrinema litorale]